jgi:hypothetical protein
MQAMQTVTQYCPYCGESIDLLIDCSEAEQNYIEDCSVCCQPMQVRLRIDAHGELELALHTDSD